MLTGLQKAMRVFKGNIRKMMFFVMMIVVAILAAFFNFISWPVAGAISAGLFGLGGFFVYKGVSGLSNDLSNAKLDVKPMIDMASNLVKSSPEIKSQLASAAAPILSDALSNPDIQKTLKSKLFEMLKSPENKKELIDFLKGEFTNNPEILTSLGSVAEPLLEKAMNNPAVMANIQAKLGGVAAPLLKGALQNPETKVAIMSALKQELTDNPEITTTVTDLATSVVTKVANDKVQQAKIIETLSGAVQNNPELKETMKGMALAAVRESGLVESLIERVSKAVPVFGNSVKEKLMKSFSDWLPVKAVAAGSSESVQAPVSPGSAGTSAPAEVPAPAGSPVPPASPIPSPSVGSGSGSHSGSASSSDDELDSVPALKHFTKTGPKKNNAPSKAKPKPQGNLADDCAQIQEELEACNLRIKKIKNTIVDLTAKLAPQTMLDAVSGQLGNANAEYLALETKLTATKKALNDPNFALLLNSPAAFLPSGAHAAANTAGAGASAAILTATGQPAVSLKLN